MVAMSGETGDFLTGKGYVLREQGEEGGTPRSEASHLVELGESGLEKIFILVSVR
jgi:hypothetical protein